MLELKLQGDLTKPPAEVKLSLQSVGEEKSVCLQDSFVNFFAAGDDTGLARHILKQSLESKSSRKLQAIQSFATRNGEARNKHAAKKQQKVAKS